MTRQDFERLLDIPPGTLPAAAHLALEAGDFTRRTPCQTEQDEIRLRVLKHIDGELDNVSQDDAGILNMGRSTAARRRRTWERCYGDMQSEDLTPPFLIPEPGTPVRLQGQYVVPHSTRFEADFLAVVRAYLFDRFFSDVPRVYEFGCGSGHNLLALAKQQPGKTLIGYDWSEAAVKLVNSLRDRLGLDIAAYTCDLFNPHLDPAPDCAPMPGVLTVGAMEQLGTRWSALLEYWMAKKPGIVVHLEPIVEGYDEAGSLHDYLAARYHRKRGYLEGYLPALRELEQQAAAEILQVHRIQFGSLYHEAYTIIAWRPR